MYNLLFRVSRDVLSDFWKIPIWAGGKLGATAIIHTTGQHLHYHPHLHFIVHAGVLLKNGKWKHSRSRGKFLFSVKQLSPLSSARFAKQGRRLPVSFHPALVQHSAHITNPLHYVALLRNTMLKYYRNL